MSDSATSGGTPATAPADTGSGDLSAPVEEQAVPYATLMGVYLAALGGFVALYRRRRGAYPPRPGGRDLALIGVATHRLSRLVSRSKITRPVRRPFTAVRGRADLPGELDEAPRGSGLRRAVGELLACPYCLAQWFATALLGAFAVAPRATRYVAGVLTAVTAADFLHAARLAVEERT